MKKIISLILTVMMVLAMGACAESIGMPNPMTQYESLEALNQACGTTLCGPGVQGVTDEAFFSIDCGEYVVAEYDFSVNGRAYTLRTASTLEDISGYYIDGDTAFASEEGLGDIRVVKADGVRLAQWIVIDGQFVLTMEDDGTMDDETFEGIVRELLIVNCTGVTQYELDEITSSLVGSWQDTMSERAMMDITDNGDGTVHILVHWASSAAEFTQWEMNARLGEDLTLNYHDCERYEGVVDEAGNIEFIPANLIPDGFFTISESGLLCWNGAADPDCADCAFELLGE